MKYSLQVYCHRLGVYTSASLVSVRIFDSHHKPLASWLPFISIVLPLASPWLPIVRSQSFRTGSQPYQAFYCLKHYNPLETGSFLIMKLNQPTSCLMLQFKGKNTLKPPFNSSFSYNIMYLVHHYDFLVKSIGKVTFFPKIECH